MADTKDFDVVRIARSDGADTGPGYWPVTAASTPAATATAAKKTTSKEAAAATEKTPRAKPQMVRLAEDDPRYIEWRVKLGILLKTELAPNPDEGNAWYVHFPRGYWLYEKSKHLWVSGYPVKAKLFKTPQEFGIHLIWLLSASRDYRDCCCIHCNAPTVAKLASSMDDALVVTHGGGGDLKRDRSPAKVTPVPLPSVVGQPQPKPKSASPAPRPPSITPASAPAPAAIPPTASVPPSSQPAMPPTQAQHQHQQLQQPPPPSAAAAMAQQNPQWRLQSQLLFRTGEMVWYQNGSTWRIGIIAAAVGNGSYEIVPLGHGMVAQPNATKSEAAMRPFYAFSVPPVAIDELKNKLFGQIAWEAVFGAAANDAARIDHLNLDASKMAASSIDHCHSLWSPLQQQQQEKFPATRGRYFGGFLGAERIELGDCLRVRDPGPELSHVPTDTAILGLGAILTGVEFPGDIFLTGYLYVPVRGHSNAVRANIVPAEYLPVALREETQWRNAQNPAQPWHYTVAAEGVLLKETCVRGRFYPTHRLLPILNPRAYQDAMAAQQQQQQQQPPAPVQEPYLNNRMDGAGQYIGRRLNRIETLGATVRPGVRIALEPHVHEEMALPPL